LSQSPELQSSFSCSCEEEVCEEENSNGDVREDVDADGILESGDEKESLLVSGLAGVTVNMNQNDVESLTS
jgi:hypothetical protein